MELITHMLYCSTRKQSTIKAAIFLCYMLHVISITPTLVKGFRCNMTVMLLKDFEQLKPKMAANGKEFV